ncbi:MAG TPA: TldD/PmbA family protein [Anaerolineae bacterium]|nr:TldD/PmbA family protein [Anaerolineae bacterium]HOR00611.1 TldD/PmbA family protein [Anaerolineae bacterium]HPL29822.1 TldD/PmbA family protein [Anaerolineae bacterium]
MFGENELRRVAEQVLAASQADETEVLILAHDTQLTRFADAVIHQNVAERDQALRVRAVIGRRTGVASTNDVTAAGIAAAVQRAADIARLQPESPLYLPMAAPAVMAQVPARIEATAACTPEARAQGAGAICRLAQEAGLAAAGAFSTEERELVVANSQGLWAYAAGTLADLNTVIMGADSSGYASRTDIDVRRIDAEGAGREAVAKALQSRAPRDVAAGSYPVVLEAYAVEEMLGYMSYMGFSALAVQEGRSFLAGRLGQQIVDPRISIWDDGLDATGIPAPFDFEGVPKRRVEIIKEGVATGVVYDRQTAAREGKESTGHGLPVPNTMGPMAGNLFMAPGAASREELVRSVGRGLYVTRFHYVNPVHPMKAVLTGMTRDGTFLIENGEIAAPVKNLRFTQGVIEALNHVIAVGVHTVLGRGWVGGNRAPDLALGEFRFSGTTQF